MTISVIVVCFNEGKILLNAVQSLKDQQDQDFEIVVVKSGEGHADTAKICDQIEKEMKVKVVRLQQNRGLSAARNAGISASRGEICVLLDADDVLPSGTIFNVRKKFEQCKSADFIFGNYVRNEIENNQKHIENCSVLADEHGFLNPKTLTKGWMLLGCSPFKKKIWEKISGYTEDLNPEDVDFWIRAIMAGFRGVYVNEILYQWNRSSRGLNSQANGDLVFSKNYAFFSKYADRRKKMEILRLCFKRNHYGKALSLGISILIQTLRRQIKIEK